MPQVLLYLVVGPFSGLLFQIYGCNPHHSESSCLPTAHHAIIQSSRPGLGIFDAPIAKALTYYVDAACTNHAGFVNAIITDAIALGADASWCDFRQAQTETDNSPIHFASLIISSPCA